MPIRFKCQNCGKRLKTADGSEGKKTRCPRCQKLMRVPETSAPKSDPRARPAGRPAPRAGAPLGLDDLLEPEPASKAQVLGLDDLLDDEPAPAEPTFAGIGDLLDDATYDLGKPEVVPDRPAVNPFLAPTSGLSGPTRVSSSSRRSGPPWEGDGPGVGSYLSTLIGCYTNPSRFFRTMVQDGGAGAPIWFGLTTWILATIANLVYNWSFGLGPFNTEEGVDPKRLVLMIPLALCCVLTIGPIFAALGYVIAAGLMHVGVLITGGSKFGFEATLRSVAYSSGCALIMSLIPIVGEFFIPIPYIIFCTIGVARLHEFSILRGILVIVMTVLIPCSLAFVALLLPAIAAAMAAAERGGM